MVLKIELPNHVLLSKNDEIVIKFTDLQNASCTLHPLQSVESVECSADSVELTSSQMRLSHFVETLKGQLKQHGRVRLTETYTSALRSFSKFRKGEDILLDDINSKVVDDYESHLKQSGLTLNTISFYMRIMRAIYNKAVKEGLVRDKKPFVNAFTKMTKTAKRAVSIHVLQKLARAEIKNKTEALARDLFLFSFYTRGMSFVDIVFLKKTDIIDKYLIYKRKKTGQELKVAWCKEMQELVNKHQSVDGIHLFGVLDQLSDKSLREQYHYKQCLVNEALKRLSNRLKLGVHLTMYVARHSWATIARQRNVPLSVISDSMGHNSEKTTQIYLKSVDADIIDRSNARLIAAVMKKGKQKCEPE